MLPLLRLPSNVILHTIRLMDMSEILGLSLTSKKCKQIVINAKSRADFFQVIIGSSINFVVRNSPMEMGLAFSFTDEETSSPKRLRAPNSVRISTTNLANPIEMMMDPWVLSPSFDFKKWLDHIRSVFHLQDTMGYVQFVQTLIPFDLNDIKKVFGNTHELDVFHTGSYEYNQLILKEFLPVKNFSVDPEVFQDSRVPKNILIQNFDTFMIGFHNEDFGTMKLEDLLLMNSKDIDVRSLEISSKEFNKFLKLWIQGAMPQLEYLSIIFAIIVEEDEVMNGINYQKNPSERIFRRQGDREEYIIPDGMDFHRKDGLKATVQINYDFHENYFELFVFHDHCVVSQL
ncbi:hypothetical protein CAEBREN_19433 [Caenorhabditis brenneri]|uniref:F-box domain-containing protein n=1 Tax=Caenorhabditis brenneri TaxID=135651 RepID=G0NQW1_CAEBE|nr:hypothetical protein CAEBREN_19433 [Caenorhabditis brenneri]